ncbi:MAG: GDSL-type esterase/lipase family protein [Verrucomicrobiales bacterium]|nr:GDSL-type esterase/lipase family protein [Verrucomicrobiales bacterium]
MKKPLNLLFLAAALGLVNFAFANDKPHAVIVVGTHHYSPNKTMPPFAAELERLGFETTVINPDWDPEKDKRGLPGLEALADADVGIFFTRFLKLDDKQLGHITNYLESGKPVVGFRTSTHAFNYPKDDPRQKWNNSFGRDALGTPYLIHLAGGTKVELAPGAAEHPILTGFEPGTWDSPGTLYLTRLEPGATPLLIGTGSPAGKKAMTRTNQFGTHELKPVMSDTIAWTWENKWGGRTFSTSLGHVGDFAVPQSMRILVNGIFWATGKEVPDATTEINPFSISGKAKAPVAAVAKQKRGTPKPKAEPAALPDTAIESDGLTLFYGNSFVERLQEDGTLESLLQAASSGKRLQFRSLAYTGDEVGFRIRPAKFGDHLGYISSQLPCDRVVMCFGMNESFAGAAGLEEFEKNLRLYLNLIQERHPGSEYLLVSPTAVEDPEAGSFPNADQRNQDIELYSNAMQKIAGESGAKYVDLFTPSRKLFEESSVALTDNGLHLNAAGNQAIARVLARSLTRERKVDEVDAEAPGFAALRGLVSRKAYEVAMAYKPANGIHYYGLRARDYEYDVEIPHHLKLASQLDKAIWEQAKNLNRVNPFPELSTAQAEPPSKAPRRGLGKIKTAEEDIKDFTVADGFEVNLFASSEEFPELINPLQIQFDARGRLWVCCFASYPVPLPGELSNDTILIFEDTDGDGKADKKTVFADGLKLPDGFVFYKDGIIVSVARRLLWLRDTDGDSVADLTEEWIRGADDTDTHHGGYLARSPQGDIIFNEALFHRGQFETPYGPVRTKNAATLYLDPVTRALRIQRQTTHPNPWKISYNRWGEALQMFGGGQIIDCDYYDVATPVGTSSSSDMGMPFRDDKGCTIAFVSGSHFPAEWEGGVVTGHLLGKNTVLFTPLEYQGGTLAKAATSLPLLTSSNKVFRPVDLKFGLDGALYVSDFYYPIIGHAQHSIRDENRDYSNGRIWRVTKEKSPLSVSPKIDGARLEELFALLDHPQVTVRELVRYEIEKHEDAEVLVYAKTKVADAGENEELGLELLWLFERLKDFSERDLFRQLVMSDHVVIRRAAAKSIRAWSPVLGEEAKEMAAKLIDGNDERTKISVISAASYLQTLDPFWADLIQRVDAPANSPIDKMKGLARLYDTPSLSPEFPLLKVADDTALTQWIPSPSGMGGSIWFKSEGSQPAILGYQGNPYMNVNVNGIPMLRATGSQHSKDGQMSVDLEPGINKIEYFSEMRGKPMKGPANLYLANLIGEKPGGVAFARDEGEHRVWAKDWEDRYATVIDSRIYLKTVPSQLAFNVKSFTVKPGTEYRFILENPDHMLHNLVITKKGQANAVGELADKMAADPEAMAKHFIPETDQILFSTPQIPHGEKNEAVFTTPVETGEYPYICTFPGHWRVMRGVMIVVEEKAIPKGGKPAPASRNPKQAASFGSSERVIVETAVSASGFKTLSPPAASTASVTANETTRNEPVETLTNGKLASNFGPIFGNGITNGAYKMDLGEAKSITAVSSWSHNKAGKRGAQRVQIFGSAAAKDPGWNTGDKSKFTLLGNIDTTKHSADQFTAASLRAEKGTTLGSYRWIVWSVSPVTPEKENTAFQELAVELAR